MATTALAKSPSLLRPLGRFSELDRKVVSEVASTSRSVYVKPGCCSVRHARKETLNLCSLQPMPNNVVGRLHSQCPSEAGYTSVSSNTLFDNLGGKLESSGKRRRSSRRRTSQKLRAVAAEAAVASPPVTTEYADEEDFVKAGGSDLEYVKLQAMKGMDQPNIADKLKALASGEDILDMVIIGCGPAGLSLAAEAAKQGLQVGLIGPDGPFVNNYGVWVDEFKAIGLEHCIEQIYTDAAIYLESDVPILVGRAYGRVGRHLLRGELLSRCAEGGVSYLNTEVDSITDTHANGSTLVCADGSKIQCRLVVVAAGAASGKFLTYEEGSQGVGVQTAYGIEIEVEDYPYDPSIMHFMDYRDLEKDDADGEHFKDLPTFLYAMPITKKRVFFEETCLAARPAMPFSVLKERLQRRLAKLGLTYSVVHEEEWSYVPVGGTLPSTTQRHMGFGAAASMIHPATGYSITRSLTEAPQFAAAIAAALGAGGRHRKEGGASAPPAAAALASQRDSHAVALQAWDCLWSQERKRQRAFMIFGLELILQLDLDATRCFFSTFFGLPEWLWRGFLATSLSSVDLLYFAFMTFVIAPNSLRFRLVKHLIVDPSGSDLIKTYLGLNTRASQQQAAIPATVASSFLLVLAAAQYSQPPVE